MIDATMPEYSLFSPSLVEEARSASSACNLYIPNKISESSFAAVIEFL